MDSKEVGKRFRKRQILCYQIKFLMIWLMNMFTNKTNGAMIDYLKSGLNNNAKIFVAIKIATFYLKVERKKLDNF